MVAPHCAHWSTSGRPTLRARTFCQALSETPGPYHRGSRSGAACSLLLTAAPAESTAPKSLLGLYWTAACLSPPLPTHSHHVNWLHAPKQLLHFVGKMSTKKVSSLEDIIAYFSSSFQRKGKRVRICFSIVEHWAHSSAMCPIVAKCHMCPCFHVTALHSSLSHHICIISLVCNHKN